MLDQLAIVRKHALCVWKHREEGAPIKTLGAIHAAAKGAHDEIDRLPKSPILVMLSILQIIYLIYWLITIAWPRRAPEETSEDELEQMLAQLSA
jgi:hypothetical protein